MTACLESPPRRTPARSRLEGRPGPAGSGGPSAGGRPVKEEGGGAAAALATTLVVDAKGRVKKTTDPNGNETHFRMDDFGRLVRTDRMLTVSTHIEPRIVYGDLW